MYFPDGLKVKVPTGFVPDEIIIVYSEPGKCRGHMPRSQFFKFLLEHLRVMSSLQLNVRYYLCPYPTPFKFLNSRIGIQGHQVVKMKVYIIRLLFRNTGHLDRDSIITKQKYLAKSRLITKKFLSCLVRDHY